MTPRKNVLALSLPASLALLAAAVLQQEPARQPAVPATKGIAAEIGVVDFDRVLQNYPGAKEKEDELKQLVQGFDEKMNALKKEQDALELARQGLAPGTPEYLDADLQAKLKALEFDKTGERFDLLTRRKHVDLNLELYDEVEKGIEAFAKGRDLKLVLRARVSIPKDRAARLDLLQASDVLFYDASTDVTDAVIQFLKTWKNQ